MSNTKRIATSSPPSPPPDLKTRVHTCLTKLSDRDTLAVATSDLQSISTSLTPDSLPLFISYVSSTSSSDKPNVRKQCIRVLSSLFTYHSKNTLLPHVSKVVLYIIKRLKDTESVVRVACVEGVREIVSEIDDVDIIMLVVKMLGEVVINEQDQNSQIGAALCLSSAIDAINVEISVDGKEIVKMWLPRVLKMLKSEFKGKGALLGVVGSVVGRCGGAMSRGMVNLVVECLVGFLGSEDWGCRKASVVALGRLAVVENVDLSEVRVSCVTSLENKRFDKVKVVRESMNQTLELWKEVPGHLDEVAGSPQSNGKLSSKDNSIGKSPARRPNAPLAKAMETTPNETIPNSKHSPIQRSSPTTPQSRSPPKSNYKKHSALLARKVDFDKETDIKAAAVPKPISVEGNCKEKRMSEIMVDTDKTIILETEKRVTEQVVANKTRDGSSGKLGGSRFGSRVVPFVDDGELDMDIKGNSTEYVYGNQKEVEDISRIQKQLVQIENQQSNLLNLLQKFIGSSRNGMNSLETRVNGLEKALDEISYDLAISTGRVSNSDSCCMGTEFLSPKYWWKTEGSFHSPRSPFRGSQQSLSDRCLPNKDFSPDSPTRGIAPNTPGGGYGNLGRSSESLLSARNKKVTQGQNRNFDRFDGGSLASYIPQRN